MAKILISDKLAEEGIQILKGVKGFEVDCKYGMKPEELKKIAMADESKKIYLGVTSFVDDEKPCWVKMDASHRIVELGGKTGSHATAGFYNVTGDLFAQDAPEGMASLRVFLKHLVDQNYAVHGVELKDVVDIDSPKDVAQAEKFL